MSEAFEKSQFALIHAQKAYAKYKSIIHQAQEAGVRTWYRLRAIECYAVAADACEEAGRHIVAEDCRVLVQALSTF